MTSAGIPYALPERHEDNDAPTVPTFFLLLVCLHSSCTVRCKEFCLFAFEAATHSYYTERHIHYAYCSVIVAAVAAFYQYDSSLETQACVIVFAPHPRMFHVVYFCYSLLHLAVAAIAIVSVVCNCLCFRCQFSVYLFPACLIFPDGDHDYWS